MWHRDTKVWRKRKGQSSNKRTMEDMWQEPERSLGFGGGAHLHISTSPQTEPCDLLGSEAVVHLVLHLATVPHNGDGLPSRAILKR